MAEAKAQTNVFALRFRSVTNAHNLKFLRETLGDADDHVVDEAASETVHGLRLVLIVRTLARERVALLRDGDVARDCSSELTLGTLDRDAACSDSDIDACRYGDSGFANTRHVLLLLSRVHQT